MIKPAAPDPDALALAAAAALVPALPCADVIVVTAAADVTAAEEVAAAAEDALAMLLLTLAALLDAPAPATPPTTPPGIAVPLDMIVAKLVSVRTLVEPALVAVETTIPPPSPLVKVAMAGWEVMTEGWLVIKDGIPVTTPREFVWLR